MSFSVSAETVSSVHIVKLCGYFSNSAESSQEFETLMEGLVKQGIFNFVFDFTKCDLINSPGVIVLLDWVTQIDEDYNGRMCFFGLSPILSNVLTTVGILCVVDTADSLEEALEAL